MNDFMICPDCEGHGGFMRHVCGGDEKKCVFLCPEQEPCERCGASGYISLEQIEVEENEKKRSSITE